VKDGGVDGGRGGTIRLTLRIDEDGKSGGKEMVLRTIW
jgi:hypothetical protein